MVVQGVAVPGGDHQSLCGCITGSREHHLTLRGSRILSDTEHVQVACSWRAWCPVLSPLQVIEKSCSPACSAA